MDIITAIAPVAQASPQSVADDSVTSSETPSFASVLEQAETANPAPSAAAQAAAPLPVAPVPSAPVAPAIADVPVEPEAEVLPAPAIPQVAEITRPEIEPEAVPAAISEDLATAVDAPADDAVDTDEDSSQQPDSLEAIRQRLDLIDTAGQLNAGILAITPPVTWTPPPPTDPELALDPAVPDDGYPTAALDWSPLEEDALAVETRPAIERPLQPLSTGQPQPESSPAPGRAATPTADSEPALPTAIASLTPAIVGGAASPSSAEVTAASTPALGSDAWQADLGQQVFAMVRRGEQQMDMQLNPADLGPLSISLNVSEGGIQAQFQSTHASVRAAVEQALPQLQVALASQGLTLSEASVNDGASRQAMGEQPRRESQGASAEARPARREERSEIPAAQPLAITGPGVDLYL